GADEHVRWEGGGEGGRAAVLAGGGAPAERGGERRDLVAGLGAAGERGDGGERVAGAGGADVAGGGVEHEPGEDLGLGAPLEAEEEGVVAGGLEDGEAEIGRAHV